MNKKDLLILDIDGVIFDVRHSYMEAIARTYEHFAGHPILREKIYEVKSQSGMNCDWDAAKYLLDESNINIAMCDIITVFQNLFYMPHMISLR